jgi:[NiFe] hydrogenase diaphorase moiety small subunit
MEIESETPEIQEIRKAIIELLFVEGNHYCPTCEMSGNCELQALAYRMKMMVPRFKYSFPKRKVNASNPKLIIDHNRCIRCKRCIRSIKDDEGRSYFAFANRGNKIEVEMDPVLGPGISDELAAKAMEVCPVGAILVKETAYRTPIGQRKYDKKPIGSEIEALLNQE